MTHVLVVGGGPAGLAAALLVARQDHEVTLVESSARLGGMAASPTVAGQRVDLGSHRLHPSASPRVRRLLDELLGDDLQVRRRHGRLRLGERWVHFPLEPADLLRTLSPLLAARIGSDLVLGAVRSSDGVDGASYADVVRARLGRTVLDRFHGPYARKLYGLDPAAIDGDVARRRVALTGLGDVLDRFRRTATPEGSSFLYPRLGYGQVVDRLADACADAGVIVRTSTAVASLRPGRDVVHATLTGGGTDGGETGGGETGDGQTVEAGRVLWTAPPTALAEAAGVPAPPLEHRGLALVYLVVGAARWTEFDAHYVPTPGVGFVRLSEPKNYRDGPDPVRTTVLCAELPCTAGDPTWRAPDTQLVASVLAGIDRLELPRPLVVGHRVLRLPRVYPLVRRGEAGPLAAAVAELEELDGVTLLGRQGLAVADNLHHVVEMAHAAANALGPDGGWDAESWLVSRRRFDDHVVED